VFTLPLMLISNKQSEHKKNKVEIPFSVSNLGFASKPLKKQVPAIDSSLKKVTEPITNLMSYIENGQSFCGSCFFKNKRKSERFEGQQIFGVDFDNTILISEAAEILSDHGLDFTFGYFTFNHIFSKPRFRLLFVLDAMVCDPLLAKQINISLHNFFDCKTDESCVDAARLWFGSKQKCFTGDISQPINLIEFLDKINFKKYAEDNNRLRGKNFVNVNHIEVEICQNTGNAIKYYYNNSHNLTKSTPIPIPNLEAQNLIEKWEVEDLMEIEIFKRFYNGQGNDKRNKLSNHELYGLATNMLPLKGGEKLFKNLLNKNSNYSPDKRSMFSYVKSRDYNPMHLYKFSPFESDKECEYQTFPSLLRKRGRVKVINMPEFQEICDAEKQLKSEMSKALDAKDTNIYLFRCAAGLGKTEIVKNRNGIVLGFPDHALKNEQYQTSRLVEQEEKLSTPSLKEKFTKDVENYFEALFSMDLSERVMQEIKNLAEGKEVIKTQTVSDVQAAMEYLECLQVVKEAGGNLSVFTTHSRALFMKWEQETIVLDENPLPTLLEQHSACKKELNQLCRLLNIQGYNVDALNHLLQDEDFTEPREVPIIPIDRSDIWNICAEQRFRSHVHRFFQSDYYFIKDGWVHYTINNINRINSDKKYIICDATAPIEIYQRFFGERLKVIDISNVKNKGEIYQYTNYSFSKVGFESALNKANIDFSLPTITFKNEKQHFSNATDNIHFGRVRGSNALSGKDINIVGTLHYGNDYYRFLCCQLNIDVSSWEMAYQQVEYGGRVFKFMAFIDPQLQILQLQTIEGELVQAVQRARLIRNEAKVYLYSNFPVAQAKYFF
jgi:hypothetical protein